MSPPRPGARARTQRQVVEAAGITPITRDSTCPDGFLGAGLGYPAPVGNADMLGAAADGVLGDLCDAVLIDRVRDGDRDAFATLYERHRPAARRFARSLVRTDSDADDVVAEVFAGVLTAMEGGKGPVGTFAPYLMSSVRNECYRVNRRGRRESADRFQPVDGDQGPSTQVDPYERLDEVAVLRVALESLPAQQRELLWRTEVDEVTPTELADGNGSTPHAMAMMALRARRALGSAYLDQHMIADRVHHELDAECRDARPHLVGYVRGTLGVRRRRRMEAHLERCACCDEAREGLGRLNRQLRVLPILPLPAGAAGTASLGIKAQVLGWLSAQAVPVAASGVLAVSVLGGPMIHRPPTPPTEVSATSTATTPAVIPEVPTTVDRVDQLLPDPVADSVAPGARLAAAPATAAAPTTLAEHSATTTAVPVDGLPSPSVTTVPPTPGAEPSAAGVPPTEPAGVTGAERQPAVADPPAGTPAEPVAGNGNADGVAGPPPGQVTDNGNAYGVAGTPPGQVTDNGNAYGIAGTPAGQVTNNGNAYGVAGTPPGQVTDTGNAHVPPGQISNDGNANGNGGAPPGHVTDIGRPAAPPAAHVTGNADAPAAAPSD